MQSVVKKSALLLAILALTAVLWLSYRRSESSDTPPPPTPPGETVAVTQDPAEIFRRAFWRQPAPADKIVHAERREWSLTGEPGAVQQWQWFIEVHPSPDLLRTLRDPETFGLQPATEVRRAVDSASTPSWFPTASPTAFEILQAPSSGLTLLYRASDNTLFATDQGHGFAAPQRSL